MEETVAVLGAGPMGLAVAYQLARDGKRPVVFEADGRVLLLAGTKRGGRVLQIDPAGDSQPHSL